MAFTVTFPTTGPMPAADDVASWLIDRGEPFEREGTDNLALRALPVRLVLSDQAHLQAHLGVHSTATLTRLVDMLFALSVHIGSDVKLTGIGAVTRASLWLRLADEQDRIRISEALVRAAEHGKMDEVSKRLWAVIAALRPGHDDRWDTTQSCIVEIKEVGDIQGISLEEAQWHDQSAQVGDTISVPIAGSVHSLAWRWLSEAYPGLAEAEHTLH